MDDTEVRHLIASLREHLPADALVLDPDAVAAYRFDMAHHCAAGQPAVVVKAVTTEHVQATLRVASALNVPVVPQGARTGLSGAANAIEGCIVLSLSRMNRILEINTVEQIAVVQPGVINVDLSRAVLDVGLFYPPDPSSWEISTIGGNIATNAGGLCCVKYGVTRDFVRGLQVVLANGDVLRTGVRTPKGVAGLDLTGMMVGSEGTLGVVTEATLALRSAPGSVLTAAAMFYDATQAVDAVARIMAGGIRPSLLEFIDQPSLHAVQNFRDMGLPRDAGAMVIAQSDRGELAESDVEAMAKLCEEAGAFEVAVAADKQESDMLIQARRMVAPALEAQGVPMFEDVVVPRARLGDLIRAIADVSTRHDVLIATCGHAGDGNMHPAIVTPRGDEAAAERALLAFDDIMTTCLELGGTITGEHGVGLLKRAALGMEVGKLSLEVQARIKAAFDPQWILNPGKSLNQVSLAR